MSQQIQSAHIDPEIRPSRSLLGLLTGSLLILLALLALNALGMLPTFNLSDALVARALETAPMFGLGICFLALGAFVGSRPKATNGNLQRKPVYIDQPRPVQGSKNGVANGKPEQLRHIFTVDLEDYFHTEAVQSTVSVEEWDQMPSRVEESMDRLLSILAESNASATVFVLGWVAQKHPQLIRRIQNCGHELACHSQMHRPVFRMTPEEFRRDTARAKNTIEDVTGTAVLGYRAPNFSIIDQTPWAFPILADLGFVYDSSTHPIHHDISNNPDAPREPHMVADGRLLELPVSTVRIGGVNWPIGGGGYFRMLPYCYSSMGLKAWGGRHVHPAVFYTHPWELDVYQPRLLLPRKARLRQYSGLGLMELKLKKLLTTYCFVSVTQVYGDALAEIATPTKSLETRELNVYA